MPPCCTRSVGDGSRLSWRNWNVATLQRRLASPSAMRRRGASEAVQWRRALLLLPLVLALAGAAEVQVLPSILSSSGDHSLPPRMGKLRNRMGWTC